MDAVTRRRLICPENMGAGDLRVGQRWHFREAPPSQQHQGTIVTVDRNEGDVVFDSGERVGFGSLLANWHYEEGT